MSIKHISATGISQDFQYVVLETLQKRSVKKKNLLQLLSRKTLVCLDYQLNAYIKERDEATSQTIVDTGNRPQLNTPDNIKHILTVNHRTKITQSNGKRDHTKHKQTVLPVNRAAHSLLNSAVFCSNCSDGFNRPTPNKQPSQLLHSGKCSFSETQTIRFSSQAKKLKQKKNQLISRSTSLKQNKVDKSAYLQAIITFPK